MEYLCDIFPRNFESLIHVSSNNLTPAEGVDLCWLIRTINGSQRCVHAQQFYNNLGEKFPSIAVDPRMF